MCAIFIYAINNERVRSKQWQESLAKKDNQGNKWILGGDFNDNRHPEEKKSGRIRFEFSCQSFREFIDNMGIEEITFQEKEWTLANNWDGEMYIEVRLDRLLRASHQLIDYVNTLVKNIERQSSYFGYQTKIRSEKIYLLF